LSSLLTKCRSEASLKETLFIEQLYFEIAPHYLGSNISFVGKHSRFPS
jgi:hypothetical protein